MPTVKEHVRNLLDNLPDNISWKQLRHELWVMEQIEQANAEIARGETIPHEQVMKEVDEWFAKLNRRRTQKRISKKLARAS
ncbi:MAG TPA: hypothetical protein VKX17_18590 [Planctomycetota bacterium]|nr:hypothetical protein [Planctomycetota bacterium]